MRVRRSEFATRPICTAMGICAGVPALMTRATRNHAKSVVGASSPVTSSRASVTIWPDWKSSVGAPRRRLYAAKSGVAGTTAQ